MTSGTRGWGPRRLGVPLMALGLAAACDVEAREECGPWCGPGVASLGPGSSSGADSGGSGEGDGEGPGATAAAESGAETEGEEPGGSTGPGEPGGDGPDDSFCAQGLLREPLREGSSAGAVLGGTFTAEGWRTSSKGDRIVWDLGQAVRAGTLSFEITGIHADVGGCTSGVCYYVGLFEEPSGDKGGDYTGSAFIESRFHTNDQENFHDVFKLQAGTGNGDMLEPLTPPMGWSAEQTHSIRIEWGPDPSDASRGRAWLYLDDAEAPLNYQAFYDDPEIGWRYLFLGTTGYKGLDWGMVDVVYRDLCLIGG